MKYLAHKKKEQEQTIKEHLFHTAELAGQFAGRFGNADWGYCAGMLHDIGKFNLHSRLSLTLSLICLGNGFAASTYVNDLTLYL